MDVPTHKLDLYSIPVFLIEVLILAGLAYSAHYLHFQYKPDPYLSGFYCDDVSLRHRYTESKLTEQFDKPDNELALLSLLLAVPILVIIFCELVNSLFGSLKFRKIRSLCQCCKLHSITRRTIRFTGAYILGFLLVMISCNIIANTTGHLKPYFYQECERAFDTCPREASASMLVPSPAPPKPTAAPLLPASSSLSGGGGEIGGTPANWSASEQPSAEPDVDFDPAAVVRPPSSPIMSQTDSNKNASRLPASLVRNRRDTWPLGGRKLAERQWIILDGVNLAELCAFSGDSVQTRRFDHLAMSWPSFPASIVSYACFFIACYLCFVGTARPFRLLTSVLVVITLMLALIFDVQLVKEHYNHWEDVLAGSVLSLFVVVFVLLVYLNKFRDFHYYQNQKLHKQTSYASAGEANNYNGYSNEIALEQFNLDKTDEQANHSGGSQHNGDTVQNNDLAMRYFQIPRANYRGAPRPLSNTTSHMLSSS